MFNNIFKKNNTIKFPLGAVRNPLDLRNIKLSRVQTTIKTPCRYFNEESLILSTYNQRQLGACEGHAYGWYATFLKVVEDAIRNFYFNIVKIGTTEEEFKIWYTGKTILDFRILTKDNGGILKCLPSGYVIIDSSPRYLYAGAKAIDGCPNEEGTYDDAIFKVWTDRGVSTINTVPNDTKLSHSEYINVVDTENILADAYPHRISGYAEAENSVKGLMSAVYQNGIVGTTISVGNYSSPLKKGNDGYHKIVTVGFGYKGIKLVDGIVTPYGSKRGRFIIKNSWWNTETEEWEVKGYGYYDYSHQDLSDLRVAIDIPDEILNEAKALPTVRIIRQPGNTKQILGDAVATYNGKEFAFKTLELKWADNAINISCIPTGKYICNYTYSKKFKKYTYEVIDVTGRTGIRIHAGNFYTDIEGCILVGNDFKDINTDGEKDVINSVVTLSRLYDFFGKKSFTLIIN